MSGLMPMALYGLEVPAGDVAITAKPEIPSAFRITMAAIDPSAEPEGDEDAVPRATLKIIRQSLTDYDSEDGYDEEDFDVEEMERMLAEEQEDEDDEDSDDEDENGAGPSDPAKSKAARKEAARKQIATLLANAEEMEVDDDEPNGVNGTKKSAKAKGKMPASDDDSEDDNEDSDDDSIGEEYEEFVLCTLDPAKNYQQPLDITVGEHERVLFKVSGTHSIFLTGNYVEPAHTHDGDEYDSEDDEDQYDLEPDSDELDDESDELDDLANPRVEEIDEDDEDEAPALVSSKADKKADKKGKNKRSADELANGDSIDELIAKEAKKEINGEEKLSKKQLKKMKKNDGTATASAVEEPSSAKSDKKVQFAKELEQGPTPTKDGKKEDGKSKASIGVKNVGGVTIDDKKLGSGPAAKKGDRVGMRYIGKLAKDGKVFDSNKTGKPFSFKLGVGEVIKGWDIGVAGMAAGGERRISIPAKLAYGSKGAPPAIPGNADLVFDVKLLSIGGK